MKLLITRKLPQSSIELLKKYPQIQVDYRQGDPLSPEELIQSIKDVDAIIPVIPDKITSELIDAAGGKLKIIANYAVGFDNIDVDSATRKGIYVSNTPGDLTQSVAEFALGLMFAISKKIPEADVFVRTGKYHYWDPLSFLGPTLHGKVIGIIGLGRIGYYLAQLVHLGLDMKIVYAEKNTHEEAEKTLDARHVELDELLQFSDFVVLSCPLTAETHHLIGQKELEQMKPTAYLINVARGQIVNEAALYTALKNRWIEGAALDVFENEPKLYDGLAELDNVILTPHIASATREARIQMAHMAINNVLDVLIHNRPPTNLVNKDLQQKAVSSLF